MNEPLEDLNGAWPDDALRLLARAGRVLGASLDLDETLADLGRLLVPELVDAVVVQLAEPDTGDLAAEFAHAIPEQQNMLRDYLARFPPPVRSNSLLATVARTGTPVLVNDVTEAWLRNTITDEEQYRAFAVVGLSAAVGLPLVARQRTVGAMSLLMTRSGRRFGSRVLLLAEEVAARAALAIDTAQLVESEQRARNALAESENFLQFAQHAAAMGVWDFTPATGAARWSEDCYRLYGRHPAAFVPGYETWLACVHDDDRAAVVRAVEEAFERGTELRIEFRIRHPHRGLRWLLEIGQAMPDASGRRARMAGVTLDITERKQTEERLRQVEKMESIGRLAGGLAHDFNNQLHALSGFTNFVARDPGLGPQSRRDLLEVQSAADRMASLTRQLLAFSRQQALTPETLDLNAAAADTQPMLHRLIGSNVEMRLELAPGPKWVRVDRTQLLQVLMNLAINARDAMPNGGDIIIRTGERYVEAGAFDDRLGTPAEPGSYVELVVSDSGDGIPPDHMGHIFEPFFTTKDIGKGTGLGLATVHGVVRQSRGHILVDSAPGAGTAFTVLLPLAAAPAPAPPPPTPVPEGDGPLAHILIVDDEEMVRRLVVRTLELEGCRVIQARHGQEALEALAQPPATIDLVISDIVMPVMGGVELAAQLQSRYPELPVIWMSGYPLETAFPGGRLPRHQPFLQKPVGADVLIQAVRTAIKPRMPGPPQRPEPVAPS